MTFCAPPVSRDKARDMLERTRGAKLLHGFRGAPALDVEAVVDALVALGRLGVDLGTPSSRSTSIRSLRCRKADWRSTA